ncbi:bifunctional preprotein translocase subunit SecD/SecF [uncultured Roseburia sp.]|uniref:Multifunctional fusion protein n=1 Tax=Brotonthovivens ammoniilytica TaxID=2981725 RepID=A0ABT2TL75_9FIRM|nr:protein translocase subunit SecD [Brotonthovivens ammoniilytica]MCU6762596.1 protein translocase subunit SecD [Brotonthovivens ammoniilytica]SCI76834.1 bifunctional preprotein translocase subunit SecD/SecF [uncultured Roseburia sp.]
MKKKKSVIVFVVFLAIVAALGYYSFGIVKGTMAKDSDAGVKLGLDLSGGVSITYQVVGDEKPSAEDMKDTVYKLQKRVEGYSTEAEAYQVGDNRIAVEIPGVTDANDILEELGQPGSLEFQTSDGEAFMTGDMIADAQAGTYQDQTTGAKEYIVSLKLTDEGKKVFGDVTSANIGKTLPIVFDGETISNPTVQSAITDGEAQITGMANYEEAENLASTIRIGSLSLELEELQSEVVGAKLGSEAISTSIKAAAIGLIVVMIFMIVFYLIPGLAAAIALLIYTGIILAILHLYDITLTLPGIAGIILSIGMAVDANVIIFARVKEEIAAGKSVSQSVQTGFRKAMSAILDGNITTLIAAAVLGLRGSGTVKGFASTLAIGIIFSMFTALFITRWILKALYGMGFQDKKFYGEKKDRKPINFLGKRGLFFVISIAVIVIGFAGMGYHKSADGNILNYSLEFVGGTSTTVTFNEDYSIEEIDEKIVPVVEDITKDANIQTQKVQDSNAVIIKTRDLSLDEREDFNKAMSENFGVDEKEITSANVSSTVSDEMKTDALWAVGIATVCMLIYIWFRFKDLRFAGSAVIALLHDVLIVFAFYVLSRTSVGNTFIACMLTIVGYSVNATIVIFDRIREHLKVKAARTKGELKEIVNASITQTLSRSINTSLTTFIMVFVLFIFGVSSIREFATPLMVGIVCGAYASVCITGALWYVFKTRFGKNRLPDEIVPESGKKKKKK